MSNELKTFSALVNKIKDLEVEISKLKSADKKQEVPQLTKQDILKLICDKIPKQDNEKLTKSDVDELIKKLVTLQFVNKLYGK